MDQTELTNFKSISGIEKLVDKKLTKLVKYSIPEKESNSEKAARPRTRKQTQSYKMLKASMTNKFTSKELDIDMSIYDSYETRIKWIDVLTMVINLATISIFYIEHFEYMKHKFTLDSKSNIIRFALLFSSVLIAVGIFLRYLLNENSLKIISNINNIETIDKNKFKRKINLIIETLIHLIQPYPYLHYEWTMLVLGQEVTYTLNLILYFLCTFRSYMLFKVVRYWNLYSSKRSKKILAFFDPYANSNFFSYKANVKMNGFITLSILGGFTLLMASFLLKTMEYYEVNTSNKFYYFWNSLWYLVVTMCTIGYGDIVPATVLGRFIGVIICLIGVLILSLIVVTLTLYTNLDRDEEEAYKDIRSFSTSYQKRVETQSYVNKLMTYRFKNNLKKVDLESVLDRHWRALRRISINIELKKHYQYTHTDFTKNVGSILDENMDEIKNNLKPLWSIDDKKEEYLEINEDLTNVARRSKNVMASCLNLANSLTKIGGIIQLDCKIYINHLLPHTLDIHQIQHKKVIGDEVILKARDKYLNSIKEDSEQLIDESHSYSNLKYTGRYIELN